MSQIKAKRKKLSAGDKTFNVFNYLLFGGIHTDLYLSIL